MSIEGQSEWCPIWKEGKGMDNLAQSPEAELKD